MGARKSLEEATRCLLFQYIVAGILHFIIAGLGLVGNTLTCVVVWKDAKTSATSFLLVVMAIVDNLVLITWSLQRAAPATAVYRRDAAFIYIWPIFSAYGWIFATVAHLMATWSVVLVTAVRYVAVCLPHRANRWLAMRVVRRVTAVVLICCVLIVVPRMFESYVIYDESSGTLQEVRLAWAESAAYWYFYMIFVANMALYVVPLSSIIFCTFKLAKSLAEARKKRLEMTSGKQEQQDITFSLVVVVLVFLVCQILPPVYRMWGILAPRDQRLCPRAFYFFRVIATGGPVFNSSVNFVIFIICGRGFRARLIEMMTRRKTKVGPSTSGSNTTSDTNLETGKLGGHRPIAP